MNLKLLVLEEVSWDTPRMTKDDWDEMEIEEQDRNAEAEVSILAERFRTDTADLFEAADSAFVNILILKSMIERTPLMQDRVTRTFYAASEYLQRDWEELDIVKF